MKSKLFWLAFVYIALAACDLVPVVLTFISGKTELIHYQPAKRMTIIDLLQGPWITGQVGQAGDTSSVIH